MKSRRMTLHFDDSFDQQEASETYILMVPATGEILEGPLLTLATEVTLYVSQGLYVTLARHDVMQERWTNLIWTAPADAAHFHPDFPQEGTE